MATEQLRQSLRVRPGLVIIALTTVLPLAAFGGLLPNRATTEAGQDVATVEALRLPTTEECQRPDLLAEESVENCSLQFTQDRRPNTFGSAQVISIEQTAFCAQIYEGPAVGSACTQTDAEQPMFLTLNGIYLDYEVGIVVVDPLRRLGGVRIREGGQELVHNDVQEEGLWAYVQTPRLPDEVVALDRNGSELGSIKPLEEDLAAREETERAKAEPPEEE